MLWAIPEGGDERLSKEVLARAILMVRTSYLSWAVKGLTEIRYFMEPRLAKTKFLCWW
jgi:hypothetical protein